MPVSPSTSTKASRPSPFGSYTGPNLRYNDAARSMPSIPSAGSSTLSDLTRAPTPTSNHQVFGEAEYQSFGYTGVAPVDDYGPPPDLVYPASSSSYAPGFGSVNPLTSPFASRNHRASLTSLTQSRPSSSSSRSPDQSFRDRYYSPDQDAYDDDHEHESRYTTPPPLVKKVSRPPNAWILYRSDRIREYNEVGSIKNGTAGDSLSGSPQGKGAKNGKKADKQKMPGKGYTQAEISRLIALQWKNEPKDIKAKYDRLAEVRKMEHQRDYPDYKYQPMKKEEKLRMKEAKEREKALNRKERALDKAMRAIIAPRRKKPKPAPIPPSPSPSPATTAARAVIPALQPVVTHEPFPSGTVWEPVKSPIDMEPRPAPASSKKKVKRTRKSLAASKRTKSHVVTDPRECGIMDGAQVFWGVAPDLPNSYVAPTEPVLPDPRGHGDAELPTEPTTESQSVPKYWDGQHPHPPLPSPEAGLAIESRSIIPYIFEPAPFEPLLSSEFQTFYGGDYYYRSQGSATGGGHPEAASLRHDPLPPVEVPGVTESELVEMWGLLEDETVGYDLNGKDENASTSTAQPNWSADPTELVNQWASLNVPIEESTYISPGSFSRSVASQIASEWHDQPYHSLQPEGTSGPSMYGYPPDHAHQYSGSYHSAYPSSSSYPPNRPGYATIEVPVSLLQDTYRTPATYSTVPQGPPLTQATPLSPVNGTFPAAEGWSAGGSFGQASQSTTGYTDIRNHRRANGHVSPYPTMGMPLDPRTQDNRQLDLNTPAYVHPMDGTFEHMQSRRVSDYGPFDPEGSPSGWNSPLETGRMPSFGDFRLPSATFVTFPDQDLEYNPEPIDQKRIPPQKKARVVASQHPPPQRIAS